MSMYSKSLSNDDELVPVGNPRTWVPYMNTRDCSQGFCSLYCPQWCYIIFPPPPPFEFPDDDDSAPNFSPLVIAIIGILASAFLLVSYYAIISKYCGRNRNATPRRRENHQEDSELDDDHEHEAWHATPGGLDEALIKSITVFKYKKGDGLTEGGTTDCSVCLSEFEQDESLRLLPKCNHAFHVMCIDTWLKSHSNCPLCRANITFPSTLPPPVMEIPRANEITPQPQLEHDIEMGNNVREEAQDVTESRVRRSVSMDDASQGRLSIADILKIEHDQDCQMEEYCHFQRDVGTSKQENLLVPMVMKRSLSSGRFLFSKRGRGQNCMVIPMSNI